MDNLGLSTAGSRDGGGGRGRGEGQGEGVWQAAEIKRCRQPGHCLQCRRSIAHRRDSLSCSKDAILEGKGLIRQYDLELASAEGLCTLSCMGSVNVGV